MNTRRRILQLLFSRRADRANETVRETISRLSPFGTAVLFLCTAGLVLSSTALTYRVYLNASTEVPTRGGEIHEGVLGIPRFVNPLFALSHADRDLIELVYAGLFTYNAEGEIVPELADRYAISNDGKTYTVTLRDATFHDGVKVTADDVVYTIHQAQSPLVKSTIQGDWNGVSVRAINDRVVEFTLSESYTPFIHNLTIGILPAHIWEPIGAERLAFSEENIVPIGAGPYRIRGREHTRDGTQSSYTLTSFEDYVLGEPLIPRMEFSFFANREDLLRSYRSGSISSSAYLPESFVKEEIDTQDTYIFPIRRVFALFFNQKEGSPLSSYEVRRALDGAAEKDFLVRTAFSGFAEPIATPFPFIPTENAEGDESPNEILAEAGWEHIGEGGPRQSGDVSLSFSISTTDAPELLRTAELLKRNFENVGAEVTLKTYSTERLLGEVIRPREYDALLFGQVIGREGDLFGYWHSSQRNDPGLNIALYANEQVDDLLEEMRTNPTEEVYHEFNEEIRNDLPALFLYYPELPYVLPGVQGKREHEIVTPHERFIDVHNWYTETRRIWHIFSS